MEFKLKPLSVEIAVNKIANVHFFEFEKNFFTKSDRHPFCELVFVSSGTLEIFSDDYNGLLQKNEMIIHRANASHFLTCPSSSAPTVIIIGFECRSEKLDYFSRNPVKLGDENVKKLAEIVKEGRNVFAPPYNKPTYDMHKKEGAPFGSEQLLKNLLEYLPIQLVREYCMGEASDGGEWQPFYMTLNQIIKYVDDNFTDKITIDELAFLFGTNRATLCAEFKKKTGKTVAGYMADKKIEFAKRKLAEDSCTVTRIADALKFDTIHYFTAFFKKHTGISPREYRAGIKKESAQPAVFKS